MLKKKNGVPAERIMYYEYVAVNLPGTSRGN